MMASSRRPDVDLNQEQMMRMQALERAKKVVPDGKRDKKWMIMVLCVVAAVAIGVLILSCLVPVRWET